MKLTNMMYKNIFLIAAISVLTVTCNQKNQEVIISEKIPKSLDTITDIDSDSSYEINSEITSTENWDLLIPDGFELLEKVSGDLNKDGITDLLLVVKSQNEEDVLLGEDAPERKLLLLLKDEKGFYAVAAENSTVIFRKNMGGAGSDDPYQGIKTNPGQFMITHMGGSSERWTYKHTFIYNQNFDAWFLSRVENGNFDADNPIKEIKTIQTPQQFGVINFIEFNGNE